MTDPFGPPGFDRRGFLRLLSGGALTLASGGLLTGCGGGGNGGSSSPSGGTTTANTQTVSGTINTAQIGGNGLLVQSAYLADAPVSSGGAFSTTASAQSAHVVVVTDSSGQIWDLTISTPSSNTAQAVKSNATAHDSASSLLSIDATSTALALIYLVPGIAATDPTDAAQRVTAIEALNSFAPIVSFLSANLPTTSLTELVQAGQLTILTSACVQEWISGQATGSARPMASDGHNFTATPVQSSNPPNKTPVRLSNDELRWVNVTRRYVGTNETDLGTPVQLYNPLSGATIATLATAFSSGSPTIANDQTDLTIAGLNAVEYWIQGPGKGGTDVLPPSVAAVASADAAWGVSFLTYLVLPFIDALSGIGDTFNLSGVVSEIGSSWNQYSPGLDIATVISEWETSGSQAAAETATVDLFVAMLSDETLLSDLLKAIVEQMSFSEALLFTAEQVALIVKVIHICEAVCDVSTILLAFAAWSTYSGIEKVSLPVNSSGTVGVTVQ